MVLVPPPRLDLGLQRLPLVPRAGRLPARIRSYLVAVVAVAVAVLLAMRLPAAARDLPPMTMLVAVAVSGSYGGLGPALVATGLAFLTLDLLFESPPFSLAITDPNHPLDLLAFLVMAILLGVLNARLRQARERAGAARVQAEAALQARDEALTIVSHDLRTPLTAIKTSVSTLRNPGTPLADTTRLELLGTIEAEADRLVHFVGDALALTRLEAGIMPDRQWTAVGEIVSAVLDRLALVLGERPISFDVPDSLPLVRVDAGLLDQSLSNILENVGVHTPPGSPISITGRVTEAGVRIEVSDAGPGVPPEARERIFAKFERLRDSGLGTGLGLAIARAAAEAQGGQLLLEDSPLGGARFTLVLPNESPGT